MKVLLLNGSPRPNGCTYTALSEVAAALEKNGIETEIFQIGRDPVHGCTGCGGCGRNGKCVFDDGVNRLIERLDEFDGLVIGSPVYYASPNGALLAFLDRLFFAAGKRFAGKPGAAVVSSAAGAVVASVLMSDAAVVSLPSLPLLSEVQAANDRIIITAMAKAKNLFISQISVGSRFFPVIRSFRYFEAADIHYLRHISGNGDRQPPFIS